MKYRRVADFVVLDSQGTRFNMDTHVHDEFVVAAYVRGAKVYGGREGEGLARPGDLLVVGPATPHSARSWADDGCHYVAIYPSVRQLADATDLSEAEVERCLFGMRQVRADVGGRALGIALRRALEEPGDGGMFSLGVFFCDLARVFAGCTTGSDSVPRSIAQTWDRIYSTPLETFDLGQLSRNAGVSREHLCRVFSATYGISPFQLLRARRTEYARNLIRGGASLATAAAQSGFADQSHMSRWFKRMYGTTPRATVPHQ